MSKNKELLKKVAIKSLAIIVLLITGPICIFFVLVLLAIIVGFVWMMYEKISEMGMDFIADIIVFLCLFTGVFGIIEYFPKLLKWSFNTLFRSKNKTN